MYIQRLLDNTRLNSVVVAIIFSICTALLISFTYFELFPNHINPTILAEPVLFREGYLPYNNIADQKTPLLQYLIAWTIPIFDGDAVLAVRSLHSILVFIIVTISLLWAFRVKGGWALAVTGLFFLTWSLSFGYYVILYYDIVLSLFFVIALFFLTKPENRQSIWSSMLFGLITGLAILIKQQAAILCILIALSLTGLGIYQKVPFKKLSGLAAGYLLGMSLPVAIFIIIFLNVGGNLSELIYWTIKINLSGVYASMAKLNPDRKIVLAYLPSLILLPPFLWSIFSKPKDKIPSRDIRLWLLLVFLSATILIYPRWSPRHLATALPFLAIISGIAWADMVHLPPKKAGDLALFFLGFGIIIWWGFNAVNIYRSYSNFGPDRFDGYSNFIGLAEDIEAAIPPEGNVVFVPTDDGTMNLYYILDRHPPSFIFFNYPWFTENYVIQRWLDAMEQDRPVAVIYFPGRLGLEQYAPDMIEYLYNHYKVDREITWEGNPVLIMSLSP